MGVQRAACIQSEPLAAGLGARWVFNVQRAHNQNPWRLAWERDGLPSISVRKIMIGRADGASYIGRIARGERAAGSRGGADDMQHRRGGR